MATTNKTQTSTFNYMLECVKSPNGWLVLLEDVNVDQVKNLNEVIAQAGNMFAVTPLVNYGSKDIDWVSIEFWGWGDDDLKKVEDYVAYLNKHL